LKLLEMTWVKKLGIDRFDKYFSPYIYYAFTKPAGQNARF